jgi:hypothetical protein
LTALVLYVITGSKERARSMTLDFSSISRTGFTIYTVTPHLHVTAFTSEDITIHDVANRLL